MGILDRLKKDKEQPVQEQPVQQKQSILRTRLQQLRNIGKRNIQTLTKPKNIISSNRFGQGQRVKRYSGKGRPRGSYDSRYKNFGGVYGFRKFMAQQRRLQLLQARAQNQNIPGIQEAQQQMAMASNVHEQELAQIQARLNATHQFRENRRVAPDLIQRTHIAKQLELDRQRQWARDHDLMKAKVVADPNAGLKPMSLWENNIEPNMSLWNIGFGNNNFKLSGDDFNERMRNAKRQFSGGL